MRERVYRVHVYTQAVRNECLVTEYLRYLTDGGVYAQAARVELVLALRAAHARQRLRGDVHDAVADGARLQPLELALHVAAPDSLTTKSSIWKRKKPNQTKKTYRVSEGFPSGRAM